MSKEEEYLYNQSKAAGKSTIGKSSIRNPAGNLNNTLSGNGVDPALQQSFNQPDHENNLSRWQQFGAPKGCKIDGCSTEPQLMMETDLPAIYDATTQTDFKIEKEIPDLRMKEYFGISKETQIYPNEPPFDFDYEAEPLVQVLMTRILEESRTEVLEEEELRAMHLRQQQLLAHKQDVAQKLKELEERERQAVLANQQKLDQAHAQRKQMVQTHQLMVARVFAKSFLRDIERDSFQILENQGMFEDEYEKTIKEEVVYSIYDDVFKNLQKQVAIQQYVQHTTAAAAFSQKYNHFTVIADHNEQMRLMQQTLVRELYQRNERRRLKLQRKKQQIEFRRLKTLEQTFVDTYMPTADIDKEMINVTDFDGSDGYGFKSVGMRGGLIGEIFLLIQKLTRSNYFDTFKDGVPGLDNLIKNFWNTAVGDAWTVTMGLDSSFEKNISPHVSDLNLDKMDMEYIYSLTEPEIEKIHEFVRIHYRSTYLDYLYPGLIDKRAKRIARVAFKEPAADDPTQGGADPNADPKDDGDDDNDDVTKRMEDELNKKLTTAEEEQEEEVETDPRYVELQNYLDTVFNLIFDRKAGGSHLKGIRFTRHITKERPKLEDPAATDVPPPPSRLLAVFIPAHIPEIVESAPKTPPPGKFSDYLELAPQKPGVLTNQPGQKGASAPNQPATAAQDKLKKQVSGLSAPLDDNADAQKVAEIIEEIIPYNPNQIDYNQNFDTQVSNVDLGKKDMDVATMHVPLLKSVTHKFVTAALTHLAKELTPERLTDLEMHIVMQDMEEVQQLAEADGRDLIYVNSY